MRRLAPLLACALPAVAFAAVAPRAWDFPGAALLIGAGSVVLLVLLGRALAAPVARRRHGGDAR